MARGLVHGWLDEPLFRPAVEKGWHAITTQIEPDGTVHGICQGTMCTPDIEYYLKRLLYDNDTHGLFAVLFAAIEVTRYALAQPSLAKSRASIPTVGTVFAS
jgi:rhamnogalacturonyl hydrolase YesR